MYLYVQLMYFFLYILQETYIPSHTGGVTAAMMWFMKRGDKEGGAGIHGGKGGGWPCIGQI